MSEIPKVSFSKQLAEHLKFSGLDSKNMTDLVKIVDTLNTKGLKPIRVFPIGIINPDGVKVETILDLKGIQDLLELLKGLPRIDHIHIFPKGIPVITDFHTEIGFR